MRLIYADPLEGKWFWTDDSMSGKAVDLDDIYAAPTIDAIEIIRCENCTSLDPEKYICKKTEETVEDDGFCFEGEKKTDDMIEALDNYFNKGEGAFASKQVLNAWERIKNYIFEHPIVNCKDCKYSGSCGYDYQDDLGMLFCNHWNMGTDDYGYCFEGENK